MRLHILIQVPKSSFLVSLSCIFVCMISIQSCRDDGLLPAKNDLLKSKLSQYAIYQGNISNLQPTNGYHLYELSTELFTDYAEKQRLVKIPEGKTMIPSGDGLPDFPDGTTLVKTFYYYRDMRDTSKGKNCVETRILVKKDQQWSAGTYLWNSDQTDANLITSGLNKTINWIDSQGNGKVISYQVPNERACASCHNANNSTFPIGPKLRNLNRDVLRNNELVNQLQHLHSEGIMDQVEPTTIHKLPEWDNPKFSLEERARAYLEVNCAHCHNNQGFASGIKLRFSYELSLEESRIANNKADIKNRMTRGEMPKIGTTIIHQEGLSLIKEYMENLK